jgi:hypothetical protein
MPVGAQTRDHAVGDRKVDPELGGREVRAGKAAQREPVARIGSEATPPSEDQATWREYPRVRPTCPISAVHRLYNSQGC